MGRKKKKRKPIVFCYYCDRPFDNEKVLIEHQRGKHFKCPVCHRRLSSARGMMIHVFQVHKESVDTVPAAKKGRDSFELDVFGMVGVPEELKKAREAQVYGQEPEAKRQKMNPVPQQMHHPQAPQYVPNTVYQTQYQTPQQPYAMNGRQQGYGMPPAYGYQQQPYGAPPQYGMGMQPPQYPRMQQPYMGQYGHQPPQYGFPPQQQYMQQQTHLPHMQSMLPNQHQPPTVQQTPISGAAKNNVVSRSHEFVSQPSVHTKQAKKKIIRVYDQNGTCMEENRARHSKYRYFPPESIKENKV